MRTRVAAACLWLSRERSSLRRPYRGIFSKRRTKVLKLRRFIEQMARKCAQGIDLDEPKAKRARRGIEPVTLGVICDLSDGEHGNSTSTSGAIAARIAFTCFSEIRKHCLASARVSVLSRPKAALNEVFVVLNMPGSLPMKGRRDGRLDDVGSRMRTLPQRYGHPTSLAGEEAVRGAASDGLLPRNSFGATVFRANSVRANPKRLPNPLSSSAGFSGDWCVCVPRSLDYEKNE